MFECREKAIENLVAENNELREHIKCLQSELEEIQRVKVDLPVKPIEVAAMLIRSTVTCKANPFQKAFNEGVPDEYEADMYSNKDLRHIAEHLLVYCYNTEVE